MANHDNMGPGTPGKKSEGEEIKLWQKKKPDSKKKRSYIYEVPTEEEVKEPDPDPVIWTNENKTSKKKTGAFMTPEDYRSPEPYKPAEVKKDKADPEESTPPSSPKEEEDQRGIRTDRFVKPDPSLVQASSHIEELSPEQRKKSLKQGMIQGSKNSISTAKQVIGFFRSNGGKILLALAILLVVCGGLLFYNRIRHYRSYKTDWQVSATDSGYSNYIALGDRILHYSQDGVNVLDLNGEILWDQAFNMDVPALAVRDDYVLIYDVKGKDFYICNAEGCTGHGTTEKKILKGDISASGVVALVLDDKKCNYINYFRKDGSQIELEIKTLITGDGYPLDIALSPDGVELMTSYIYAAEGKMLSEVVFRNFEVGKNDADRVVGGFKGYAETLVPDVMFFDNQSSAAVTEYALDFYSTKNALRPALEKTVNFNEPICAVASNQSHIAVILEAKKEETAESAKEASEKSSKDSKKSSKKSSKDADSKSEETAEEGKLQAIEYAYQLKVFDQKGKMVFEDEVDFPYTSMNFSGEGLFVYNKTTCAMYNMTGVCKYKGSLNVDIDGLMRFGEKTIVAYGSGALQKLTLK